MDSVQHIATISELNKLLGQEEPAHPLITIIDYSKVDFTQYSNIRVSMGFYTIMEKNLCPGEMRYGRNYYDFQEGSLFFMAPNQVITLENPDETKLYCFNSDRYNRFGNDACNQKYK